MLFRSLCAIWTAFVGGLLWDLRWVGIPGFFTLGYVAVVMLVLWMWSAIPSQGRTMFVAFLLLEASLVLPPLVPVLIVGGGVSGGFFLVQQLRAVAAAGTARHQSRALMRERRGGARAAPSRPSLAPANGQAGGLGSFGLWFFQILSFYSLRIR